MLTIATAQMLLASIANSPVQDIQHLTNTNDVFKVVTARDGNFFVKFHTSPWYKEAADTAAVVQREAAVYEMLTRKGIGLDYRVWTDYTRRIVDRSVLITSELAGQPLPMALKDAPAARDKILMTLACFFKRLHEWKFLRAGYIEFGGDRDLPLSLDPQAHPWWNSHVCHKPEHFRESARQIWESRKQLLPESVLTQLAERFERIPESTGGTYSPPRFVINNYHPFHVHITPDSTGWRITGLYDFEAASAGNPVFDLVGNELQLTPVIGDLAWRPTFYQAYGQWPDLETYKTALLYFLVRGLGQETNAEIPDRNWLINKLPSLIKATEYESLQWYPG